MFRTILDYSVRLYQNKTRATSQVCNPNHLEEDYKYWLQFQNKFKTSLLNLSGILSQN